MGWLEAGPLWRPRSDLLGNDGEARMVTPGFHGTSVCTDDIVVNLDGAVLLKRDITQTRIDS